MSILEPRLYNGGACLLLSLSLSLSLSSLSLLSLITALAVIVDQHRYHQLYKLSRKYYVVLTSIPNSLVNTKYVLITTLSQPSSHSHPMGRGQWRSPGNKHWSRTRVCIVCIRWLIEPTRRVMSTKIREGSPALEPNEMFEYAGARASVN